MSMMVSPAPQAGHPLFANGPYPSNPQQIAGMLHTRSWGNRETKFKTTFASEVLRRYPDGDIKLFPLIDMLSSGTSTSVDHGYNIKNMSFPSLILESDAPEASARQTTTLHVRSTAGIIPNMLYTSVPFGEQMLVISVPSEHQVVVMRQLGSILAYPIKAGTRLSFSGTAFEEGSLRPLTRTATSTRLFVHSQIFRDTWATTDTARVIATQMGDGTYAESKSDAMYNHSWAIEMAMLLGQKSATIFNGNPMRTMSGIREFVTANAPQNVWTITKPLSYEELNVIFDSFGEVRIGTNNNNSRVIWCDRQFYSAINQIGRIYSRQNFTRNVTEGKDSFGQRFKSFQTDRMDFTVYEHPLLNLGEVSGNLKGFGLVIDPTTLSLKYLPHRKQRVTYFNAKSGSGPLMEMENDNGVDGAGGTITSELMLLCSNPAANGIIFGLQRGVCDEC